MYITVLKQIMENSTVNKAHYQHRRADTHLRYRRFDEAIECQQKAAELLEEALQYTAVPRAIESLKLQRDFHLKQVHIIKVKKEQFENFRKAIENQQKRMPHGYHHNEFEDKQENESTNLQIAIYKKMEEADSLLELLIRRGTGSDTDSLRSDVSSADTDERVLAIDAVDGESSSSNTPLGRKCPKDENTVIEELRTLNQQLHALVYQLVTQLDETTRESDALRSRVKYLESERLKHVELLNQQENNEPMRNHNLRVITDSSGGTSPFVFSPCSELSPEATDARVLPTLTPLEFPAFDFSSLAQNTKS